MPWLKIDDNFSDHPKIMLAGPMAGWLYICGLCYAGRYLTDGHIPAAQIRKLADLDHPLDLAANLVDVGLWIKTDTGYLIHDYLEFNPSAEKVKAERAATAKRQAEWREKHRNDDGSYSEEEQVATDAASHAPSNAVANAVTNATVTTVPSPSPSPSPSPLPVPIPEEREVGVFAPTAAKPPPPKPRKPRDSRWRHPAVSCIKKVLDTKRNPPKAILDDLIAVLGNRPDAEKLLSCRKAWVSRGYNNNSWAWALEWYRDGIPGWAARKGTSKRNGDGMANLSPEREAEYDRITEMHIANMEGG